MVLLPSNVSPVITPNSKSQIHKALQNTILISDDSMISDINENISKKHPMEACLFPGVSVNSMHHIHPILPKSPGTIIFYVGTNGCVNKFSCLVLNKVLNLITFIQSFLPHSKIITIIFSYFNNRTDDGKTSLTVKQSFEFSRTEYCR